MPLAHHDPGAALPTEAWLDASLLAAFLSIHASRGLTTLGAWHGKPSPTSRDFWRNTMPNLLRSGSLAYYVDVRGPQD